MIFRLSLLWLLLGLCSSVALAEPPQLRLVYLSGVHGETDPCG